MPPLHPIAFTKRQSNQTRLQLRLLVGLQPTYHDIDSFQRESILVVCTKSQGLRKLASSVATANDNFVSMAQTSPTYPHIPGNNLRPRKPALKLTSLTTPHIQLPPMDLTALVAESIRACPSPRRNTPEFRMSGGASAAPAAPPPTPTEDSFLFLHTPNAGSSSGASSPRSEKRVHFEPWLSEGSADSPRSSSDKDRDES